MNYNSWYFVIFEIVVQLTKYIVQLLHQHDCVIIPDFGGFVAQYKPATLDNGLNIQVPPFIESGDNIIVDTRTIEYIKEI